MSPVAIRLTALWTAANILLLLPLAWVALRASVSAGTLGLALALVAATLAAAGIRELYLPVAQIVGRFPASSAAVALTSSLAFGGGAVIAISTGSWLAVAAWYCAMAAAGALAVFGIARSARATGTAGAARPPESGAVLRYGTIVAAPQMIGAMIALGERVAVAAWFGPAAIGGYSLAWVLALATHGIVASAATIFPVTASRLATETLAAAYDQAMSVAMLAIVTIAAAVLACGPEFLRLWVGGSTAEYAAVSLFPLTIAGAVLAALALPWMLAEARGFANLNLKLFAGAAAIMVIASPVLLPRGLFMFSVARALSLAGAPLYVVAVERRVFGAVRRDLWVRSATRLLLVGALAWVVMSVLAGPTWTRLGIALGAGMLTSLIAASIIGCIPITGFLPLAANTAPAEREA